MYKLPLFLVSLILLLSGCPKASHREVPHIPAPPTPPADRGVEVALAGTDEFPSELAGLWRADRGGWEFYLEPDGSIRVAQVSMGRVRVVPGRVNEYPLVEEGEGYIEPGTWTVQYSARTKELVIQIVLDEFRWQRGDKVVEGSSKDVFAGPILASGTLWKADWVSFPTYFASTAEQGRVELPVEPGQEDQGTLTFTKVRVIRPDAAAQE